MSDLFLGTRTNLRPTGRVITYNRPKPIFQEMKAKKIPIIVRRYLPDGSYEDW